MTDATHPDANLDWLVSVDDHVLEPPMVWQDRVPHKFRDQAPRIVTDDTGEYWLYEDKRVDTVGLTAAAGKTKEEFTGEPVTYSEMRPGCYDANARLEDMDRAGILASLCFPSFPRFCGQVFYEAKDRELALLCVKAYNDWILDEWCGAAPGRFIPLMIIPLWSPSEAVKEIERCAERNVHALSFSENPAPLGLPSIHDPSGYWGPVFGAANDADMVICTHIGSSSNIPMTSADAPAFVAKAWSGGVLPSGTLLDWIFSGWFERLPNLKLALSEGGIGWIPYFLQSGEYTVDRHRYWLQQDSLQGPRSIVQGSNAPASESVTVSDTGGWPAVDFDKLDVRQTFRDHVYGCFLEDMHGIRSLDEIGVDNVMVETDYPHTDSTWPNSIEIARRHLADLNDEDAYKILRGNAERIFQFESARPTTTPLLSVG